jgi:hypothetical protein
MFWSEEGVLELLANMLRFTAVGWGTKSWERDNFECENVAATAAVR